MEPDRPISRCYGPQSPWGVRGCEEEVAAGPARKADFVAPAALAQARCRLGGRVCVPLRGRHGEEAPSLLPGCRQAGGAVWSYAAHFATYASDMANAGWDRPMGGRRPPRND